jgi:hypothetical protein
MDGVGSEYMDRACGLKMNKKKISAVPPIIANKTRRKGIIRFLSGFCANVSTDV